MKKIFTLVPACLFAMSVSAIETWTVKAPMPSARLSMGAVSLDSFVYAVGGADSSGAVTNTLFAYNVYTNTWTTKAPMPTARTAFQAAVVNGKIYAIGGFDLAGAVGVVEEYNPTTNTWTSKASMPTARSQFSTAVIGNKIYACGGWSGAYPILEVYDPATNTWTTKAPMPYGKIQDNGGAAMGGKFYFMGGKNYANTAFYDSVSIYDPVSNSWSVGPNMPESRYAGATAYLKGRIFFMCGASTGHTIPNTRSNFYFDSASNSWHSALACLEKRVVCAAVVGKNKRIYLMGGVDSTGSNSVRWNHEYYNDTLATATGIDEVAGTAALHIYPNPCKQSFSIELPQDGTPEAMVYVVNVAGQEVIRPVTVTRSRQVVNVQGLAPGAYTVITATASGIYSNALVVE